MRLDELGGLLEGHRPADPLEAASVARLRSLWRAGTLAWSRARAPLCHLTASAMVFTPDGESVLLVHHSGIGRWIQPGGHVEDEDEQLLGAALRELREETGLQEVALADTADPLLDVELHEVPSRGAQPAHLHVDLRFLFVVPSPCAIAPQLIEEARWFRVMELQGDVTDDSVRRAVARAHRRLVAGMN